MPVETTCLLSEDVLRASATELAFSFAKRLQSRSDIPQSVTFAGAHQVKLSILGDVTGHCSPYILHGIGL